MKNVKKKELLLWLLFIVLFQATKEFNYISLSLLLPTQESFVDCVHQDRTAHSVRSDL